MKLIINYYIIYLKNKNDIEPKQLINKNKRNKKKVFFPEFKRIAASKFPKTAFNINIPKN